MQTERPATTALPVDGDPDPEFFALVMEKVRGKGLKYSLVSVVNVLLGQGLLLILHGPVGLGATKSNGIAIAVSAVPAYYLNRAWVWERSGKSDLWREVIPFWFFVFIGFAVSSAAVHLAARNVTNKLVPNIASLCAFGVLWVIRFFILDRMFQKPHEDFYEVVGEEFAEIADQVVHHDTPAGPDAS